MNGHLKKLTRRVKRMDSTPAAKKIMPAQADVTRVAGSRRVPDQAPRGLLSPLPDEQAEMRGMLAAGERVGEAARVRGQIAKKLRRK